MEDIITQNLAKSIQDILHYKKEDALDMIVNTVFENIMKAERTSFLNEQNNRENKANGYYSRLLKSVNKYYKLKIPRDRRSLFSPVFLDIAKEEDEKMQNLAYKLYVQGLSTRAIEDIFKDTFDKSLSPTSVSNITKEFEDNRKSWTKRKLEEDYYFIFVDALYIPVRRDNVEKEAFYIVLGLRKDLKRDVLGVYNIPVESAEGWESVFEDIKSRGVKNILMAIGDGLKSLEKSFNSHFPNALFQKCLIHKLRRVIIKVRSGCKEEIKKDFWDVFKLEDPLYTEDKGQKNLDQFLTKWGKKYPSIHNLFDETENTHYFSYLQFPISIHRMIYNTNWIERLNKEVRKTQRIRNSFPNPDSAMNLVCAFLMGFEEKTYSHPVSSFSHVKDILDDKMDFIKNQTQLC